MRSVTYFKWKGDFIMRSVTYFKRNRVPFIAVLVGFASIFTMHFSIVQAEVFPSREIELVTWSPAGGATDIWARVIGAKATEYLKVPFAVINKPGGGGAIATSAVAKAEPDGYTILTAGGSNLGTLLATRTNLTYSLNDFSAIARTVRLPLIIVAKKGRFNDFASFIKEAKEKPNTLSFASWGTNSSSHLIGELIALVSGIKIKHVPFQGGTKGMVAVLGGHTDIVVATLSTCLPHIKAGTLTCLAVSSRIRSKDVPDAPTLTELGFGDATYEAYDGLVTGSKVPKERITILQNAVEKSLKDQEVQKALEKVGLEPMFMSGPDYDALIAKELERLTRVVRDAGIMKE
jgi:tripartite-type tricarboxylate transporter receptor subunit TctC